MSAQSNLDSGRDFPYDAPGEHDAPPEATDWAHSAARGIFANLLGRAGVGKEISAYDAEIRKEIVNEAAAIVRMAYRQGKHTPV